MNTSRKDSDHFLGETLSPLRMESFLVELANTMTALDGLGRMTASVSRLIAQYPEMFASLRRPKPEPDAPRVRIRALKPMFLAGPESKISTGEWSVVENIQTFLRLAWDATDLRRREWAIFEARRFYREATVIVPIQIAMSKAEAEGNGEEWRRLAFELNAARDTAPALTPFERVAYHFHRIAERARRCANSECPAPYFFAVKKGQKYCSSKCSAPSQRDQKRRWWRENRAKNGGAK